MFIANIVNKKNDLNLAFGRTEAAGRFTNSFVSRWMILAVSIWGISVGGLMAQEVLTLDFPFNIKGETLPVGLEDWPVESSEGLARIEIPLARVNDEGNVLVSVVFEDDDARVIQAKWVTSDRYTTILIDNISENIKGVNQRVFEVGHELLAQSGRLIFETDAEEQPIKRVSLSWTWPTGVFTAPSTQAIKYVTGKDRVYTEHDLASQSEGAVADTWLAGVWRATLQENIESLDEPIQFSVPIDRVPRAVIFRARVLGFSLDALVSVWVNGREIKPLLFETPALGGAGYFRKDEGALQYAGWREAAVVIPVQYLVAGENAIILDAQPGAYVKESLLELNFEEEGAPLALDKENSAQPSDADHLDLVEAEVPIAKASTEALVQEPSVVVSPEAGGLPISQLSRSASLQTEPVVVVARPDTL